MDQILRHVGKVERTEEYVSGRYASLVPTNKHEHQIVDCKTMINSKEFLLIEEAKGMYLTLRMNRHELWCELLYELRTQPHYKFGDTRVEEYVKKVNLNWNLGLPDPPTSIRNKTPDMMFYEPRDGIHFVGDVAVAKVEASSDRRKYEKYLPIKKYLEENGAKVIQHNFVILEDLTNVDQKIRDFNEFRIIGIDRERIEKTKQFHKLAGQLMDIIKTKTQDNQLLADEIAREDAKGNVEESVETGLPFEPVEGYVPKRTEEEIVNWIKEETDKTYKDYFDNGYEDSKLKFTELYKNFETKPHMAPKSTLKVVHNSQDVEELSGYALLKDVIKDIHLADDEPVANYVSNFLPSYSQAERMEMGSDFKDMSFRDSKVYGKWQYKRMTKFAGNFLTMSMEEKLGRGKNRPNEKKEPRTIDPKEYDVSINIMDKMITNLGSVSNKPHFLNDTWDTSNNMETENTLIERENYRYVKSTNGAQLGHSMSNFYQRLMHVRAALSTKDNIFIPPNGSFICFVPSEHQPFNEKRSDVPMIFVTRRPKGSNAEVYEYEYTFTTPKFEYFVSKLARLPLSKMAHWDQAGHKIVAVSAFLLNQGDNLIKVREKVVGTISVLSLDLHQKTSELLDLLKYVSFMPFANISRLSTLIEDKFDIMLKTNLDVWVIKNIEEFMNRLGEDGSVKGIKERTKVFNGCLIESSLGMKITIPSFFNKESRHETIQTFIEEMSTIYIVRGKQFYGGQYMDKSITNTAEWNNDFLKEVNEYEGWTKGHDDTRFPFKAKFCFSSDAIYYAQKAREQEDPIPRNQPIKTLFNIKYDTFMHNICSLRGCTKDKKTRLNDADLHTTSLDACIDYYTTTGYDSKRGRITTIAHEAAHSDIEAEYCMSEKEQRGGGRPIATPTLKAKAMNAAIEKPEQAIGQHTRNNILVAGKHKLLTQSQRYKELIEAAHPKQKKLIYQCTEDQTKFSENDNTRKYETYIRCNDYMTDDVKYLQLKCLDKMLGRWHLVKKLPKKLMANPDLLKYSNTKQNGIRAIIGWPQGMLNNISTSIHSIADYWITQQFNKVYGHDICVKGLVHSDDSWFAIACDSEEEFKKYTVFRMLAKRLFCLKLNEKKLWGSKMLGELVSNFNINGEVLVPIGKVVANSFGNLMYQNWVMDVHSQISTIQQMYRQGANLGTIVTMATILRQQLIGAYNVKPELEKFMFTLPIELGGYPNCSVFELGVSGVNAHYKHVYDYMLLNPESESAVIVKRAMTLSQIYHRNKEQMDVANACKLDTEPEDEVFDINEADNEDYSEVIIPRRAEVFSAFKHILPKNRKTAKTIKKIKDLPFETDGLELLVTRPRELSVALGHLKSQTGTLLFDMAADKYTSNNRRLALNQAIQASGKTVRIAGHRPMTLLEVNQYLLKLNHVELGNINHIEACFQDDSSVVQICDLIVRSGTYTISGNEKKRKVNKMPDFENKYKTIVPLRCILLHIVDQADKTNHVRDEGLDVHPIDLVRSDASLIMKRFEVYFNYYEVKYACNMIMQQYLSRLTPKLWMQPDLRTDDLQNFLEDLYGKTLNAVNNYRVSVEYNPEDDGSLDKKVVQSLYTMRLLNELYEKFEVATINGHDVISALNQVDYANLSQSDYLKYAILKKLYCEDEEHLRNHDLSREFAVHYEKMQRKDDQGRYYGDFIVYCKFGRTTLKILGRPGDVVIHSNTNNMYEILRAMYLYVCKDHREYKYSNHLFWYQSTFWQTSILNPCCSYLKHYGGSVTHIINSTHGCGGLGFMINKACTFPHMISRTVNCTYEIGNTLRVVYRITKEPNPSRIRVDSVKQNMLCPLIEKIQLNPDTIDGFINQDLLIGGLILHVTMRRAYSAPTSLVKSLLKKRIHDDSTRTILSSFCQIIKKTKKSLADVVILEPTVDVVEFTIEGQHHADFVEQYLETEPEVLESVEQEHIMNSGEMLGAVVKHTNLHRFFCESLSQKLTSDEICGLLRYCITNEKFREGITQFIEDTEQLTDVEGFAECCPRDRDLANLIIANELDLLKTYQMVTQERLKNSAKFISTKVQILGDRLIKYLVDITIGETDDPIESFFE